MEMNFQPSVVKGGSLLCNIFHWTLLFAHRYWFTVSEGGCL